VSSTGNGTGTASGTAAREPFTALRATYVVLPADDVDTDQIIPARFLKTTDKRGLGESLFADWRDRPGFPLTQPDAAGARILVAGNNFGCGSSREHAPWALTGFGFRAIVALSFADIFRQNSLKNGLLPVAVGASFLARLADARSADPAARIDVDLPGQTVGLVGGPREMFDIDPFAKECLVHGVDELGYLLARLPEIERHEAQHR
jgi:3-isopropylmalate/(R)-2-methylmalate dehydratase small subunit